MAKLLGLIVGALVTWMFGQSAAVLFNALFGSWVSWAGYVGLGLPFFLGYTLTASTLQGVFTGMVREGLFSSAMMRPVKGFAADVIVWGIATWLVVRGLNIFWIVFPAVADKIRPIVHSPNPDITNWLFDLWALGVLLSVINWGSRKLKIFIGRATRPFRRFARAIAFGQGGSSRFHGMLEEWANPWKPGMLLLGTSLHTRGWKVGVPDDRHFISIATSRSGKGRSGIIPNLLTWPGSTLVIDPKGQNAAVTLEARLKMGQAVYVVDPFQELERVGVDARRRFRFNPLAEIRPDDVDVVEQCGRLADALVKPDPHSQAFFIDSARQVLAGVIAHVLTSRHIDDDQRTLITVRRIVNNLYEGSPVIAQMSENEQAAGLPMRVSQLLVTLGDRARGDVLGTVIQQTEWLDSLAMHDCLGASEFKMADLKETPMTIYLVLPPEYLNQHGRFLRMFVNMALSVASRGRKPKHSVLFVLDEFYALGPMMELAKSAGLLAGFGVKLWPIVQNLGQLQELYPQNWETFLGNAGLWQVFAANDETTARYLSERLGHHIAWRKVRGPDGMEWMPQGATWLRTSVEFAQESSRASGNEIIFQEGGTAFLLRRSPYDRMFKRTEYAQDPFESPPRGWRAIGGIEGFPDWLGIQLLRFFEPIEDAWMEWREKRAQSAKTAKTGKGD